MTEVTISKLQAKTLALTPASSPEFINAIIQLGTDLLVEVLRQRGLTGEEAIAKAREITAAEIEFIDSEIAKYSN